MPGHHHSFVWSGSSGGLGKASTGPDTVVIDNIDMKPVGTASNVVLINSAGQLGTGITAAPPAAGVTKISGVFGVTTVIGSAIPVLIDTDGQLGTVSSSIKFKEDVHDMNESSNKIMNLRPVTFKYKRPNVDGLKPLQYGLIAEEVEEVFPELVVRDKDGEIQTVQYQILPSLLLNEVQKLRATVDQLVEEINILKNK